MTTDLRRGSPPGRYILTGSAGSLTVEVTGRLAFIRQVEPDHPGLIGEYLSLPEPLVAGGTAIWTQHRNPAGGLDLIRIGTIESIELLTPEA